jgi:NADH dehydrogenase
MIETRHIVTPIRAFCKRARFYEANVESIDLDKKRVTITNAIGDPMEPVHVNRHILSCDYLVIALGGETNFFGMEGLKRNAFTLKTLQDAMILRNHVISMLEQADIIEHESNDNDLRKSLMTFMVVGGGFGGVEAVGELNTFVQESIRAYYHNIDIKKDVRVVLVNSGQRILPEVSESLSEFALQKLRASRVEVILNKRLVRYTDNGQAELSDGTSISTFTLIWAGGVTPSKLIKGLPCEHDKKGRIVVSNYLRVHKYDGVFALGDCASIVDPHTNEPYPPTAQHAIREGKVAAKNVISIIEIKRMKEEDKEETGEGLKIFDYKTKGTMAEIGRRNGVADILGLKVHGFVAWWIWRTYYLANLPTIEKKVRVMVDWTVDLFFRRDVTKLKTFLVQEKVKGEQQNMSGVKRTTEVP